MTDSSMPSDQPTLSQNSPETPEIIQKPPFKWTLVMLVLSIILLAGVVTFFVNNRFKNPAPVVHKDYFPITPEPTIEADETLNWKSHSYPEFGLSFKAPKDFSVSLEGVQTGFALYIQNNEVYPGEGKGYYQLYGIFQESPALTDADLEKDKDMLDLTTVHYRTVDKYRAIQGQIKGERNRYYTSLILKPSSAKYLGKFALFTSDPIKENEILTDKILSTFTFLDQEENSINN